jgi:hypothetical protein
MLASHMVKNFVSSCLMKTNEDKNIRTVLSVLF